MHEGEMQLEDRECWQLEATCNPFCTSRSKTADHNTCNPTTEQEKQIQVTAAAAARAQLLPKRTAQKCAAHRLISAVLSDQDMVISIVKHTLRGCDACAGMGRGSGMPPGICPICPFAMPAQKALEVCIFHT